jgi:hypothetical protein
LYDSLYDFGNHRPALAPQQRGKYRLRRVCAASPPKLLRWAVPLDVAAWSAVSRKSNCSRQNFVKNLVNCVCERVANMFNNTNEHVWQFHVSDASQFKDNGRAYFEARASEMAATIGCHLAATKNVQLEFVRGRWTVTGTAVLDSLKATA